MSENKTNKPKKNFFVFYCIVLFLFAAILITFSYLSNARMEQQLVSTTEKAEGFESSLEKANAKIKEFETAVLEQKTQIDTLTKQVTDANTKITEQDKKIAANEQLLKLIQADEKKNKSECRTIIAAIDTAGLRTYLSEEGLKILEEIEKSTKGV